VPRPVRQRREEATNPTTKDLELPNVGTASDDEINALDLDDGFDDVEDDTEEISISTAPITGENNTSVCSNAELVHLVVAVLISSPQGRGLSVGEIVKNIQQFRGVWWNRDPKKVYDRLFRLTKKIPKKFVVTKPIGKVVSS